MADAPSDFSSSQDAPLGIGLELAVAWLHDPRQRQALQGKGAWGRTGQARQEWAWFPQDLSALPNYFTSPCFSCLGELGRNPEHQEAPFPPLPVNHPPSKGSF